MIAKYRGKFNAPQQGGAKRCRDIIHGGWGGDELHRLLNPKDAAERSVTTKDRIYITVLVNVGKCIQIYPNHYLDYFTIEELLQNSIKYGHYLMALYGEHKGENNGYGRYYEMRQFLSLTVADI